MKKDCWNRIENFLKKGFLLDVNETTLDQAAYEIKICTINGISYFEFRKSLESYFKEYDGELSPTEYYSKEGIKKVNETLAGRNVFLESKLEYYISKYDESNYPYDFEVRYYQYTDDYDFDNILTSEIKYPIPYENFAAVDCLYIIKEFINHLIQLNESYIQRDKEALILNSFTYKGSFDNLKKCYDSLVKDGWIDKDQVPYQKVFKPVFSNKKIETPINWLRGANSLKFFINGCEDYVEMSKKWITTSKCFLVQGKVKTEKQMRRNTTRFLDSKGTLAKANYVYGKFNNFNNLFKELIPLVQDFANKSNFNNFYSENEKYYNDLIKKQKKLMPAAEMWKWLEKEFPNHKFNSYKIVFSPLIKSSHSTQKYATYNHEWFTESVMFVSGTEIYDLNKELTEKQKEGLLSGILFTEIDHNYVNPTSAKFTKLIDTIFSKREVWVETDGDTKLYDTPMAVFNEYMTHSLFCLFAIDNYDKETADYLTQVSHV